VIEREAAPGIHRIEDRNTNFYVVEADGRYTVVDAGLPISWPSLKRAVGSLDRIDALVLTHGHFDHIGIAEKMRTRLGIPVYVHEDDVPLTLRPKPLGGRGGLRAYLEPKARPVAEVQRITDADETLAVPGSPRIVFTPGHTAGHVAFHFPDRDAVIVGDAVVMLDPFTAAQGPQIVSGTATADPERALASLDALAATGAGTVLTGHGPAWRDGAAAIAERARERGVT
jgi:glyoxylase-like metal-dependent hydrolase (beta-lactamase superfamily II)